MHEEIIILSDLWGIGKSHWLKLFERELEKNYSITFYDACDLGEIKIKPYNQEFLHNQFVEFGLKNAVNNLKKTLDSNKIIIGCSIGGVIAWMAENEGLEVDKLITISSTRLRYQTKKPKCETYNYFGNVDTNKPDSNWIESIGLSKTTILNGGHDIYKELSMIKYILKDSNIIA